MLHTQPIKAPRWREGEYYSVMSRHTLSDGVTSDVEIECDPARHLTDLAPSDLLVGSWYKGRLGDMTADTFETAFRDRYLNELASKQRAVDRMVHEALQGTVTLLCIEETPPAGELLLCHRRLLAEYCAVVEPTLKIEIQ